VRYATALCSGDHHAGEDVAQETAIRLWQRPWVLESEQSLSGWLRTVARNIVIDRARRRAARPPEVLSVMQHEPAVADTADDVVAELAVDALLSGLSPAHRDALREVYARDQGVVRAAARLGIPVGTVKSRCHHALRDLRRRTADRRAAGKDAGKPGAVA
jgi:RNA polymerase sigma-70 factor (ECF subfamily)